jgi:hypothetical protein
LRDLGTVDCCRKLKNSGLLEKNDLAVWKFQRLVMGSRVVLIDLSTDCGLVVEATGVRL